MIFIYNETNLNLALTCTTNDNDATSVALIDKDRPDERTAIITSAGDQTVAEAMVNRYTNGVDITSNLSKEYIMVKGVRILMRPEDDTTISVGRSDEKIENNGAILVKNMVVLILHHDSKFFMKAKNLSKKAKIMKFSNEYKVVVMYVKTNNWSHLREPMNVLIQSGYGFESNVSLDMVADSVNTNGKDYTHNVMNVSVYDGEFPQITRNNKPYNKVKNYNNNFQDKKFNNRNYNSKGNAGNFNNSHRNNNRGR